MFNADTCPLFKLLIAVFIVEICFEHCHQQAFFSKNVSFCIVCYICYTHSTNKPNSEIVRQEYNRYVPVIAALVYGYRFNGELISKAHHRVCFRVVVLWVKKELNMSRVDVKNSIFQRDQFLDCFGFFIQPPYTEAT